MTLKASKIREFDGCSRCHSDRLTAFSCSHRPEVEVHCMSCGYIEQLYPGQGADLDAPFAAAPPPPISRQVEDEFRAANRIKSWIH